MSRFGWVRNPHTATTYLQCVIRALLDVKILLFLGLVNAWPSGWLWWGITLPLFSASAAVQMRLLYWKRRLVRAKEEQAWLHYENDKRLYGVDPSDFLDD